MLQIITINKKDLMKCSNNDTVWNIDFIIINLIIHRYVTHCLLHVTQNLEQLEGNLDAIAAWPFESLARIFKPFLRTGFKPINQLNNRLMERYVHHVPTFMDMVHSHGNRMKYVMGDIGAAGTNNVTNSRKQHHISQANLDKTATEYSQHMQIQTVAEAKQSSAAAAAADSTNMTAGKTPLRMFMAQAGLRGHRSTETGELPSISKRLTYDSFELGNNYPNNCALVVDTRKWREKREIQFHVIIIHDIFASKIDEQDKLDLHTLKEIHEHIMKPTKNQETSPPHPQQAAASTSADAQSALGIGDMQPRKETGNKPFPEILFRMYGSKFQETELFSDYPSDSSRRHVYKVGKPRTSRSLFLANQVCAKMIALPMTLGKPYNIAAEPTITNGINEQRWHVAPLLHALSFCHTKIQSSFASTQK